MFRLRTARHLARLMLAWFVLSIGVAVAAPMVQPQGMVMVCAGQGGVKLLARTDDGAAELPATAPDCPLCAQASAPPPATAALQAAVVAAMPSPVRAQTPPVHRAGAPLPARGPPLNA